MTHTLLLIHSATYFGLCFICIVEWAAALGDDSPFSKIPNNNNNTINDINNKCNSSNNNSETKRWRKRAISRKIYNVDWYIYRQYAAIDAPCVWIPFFSFAFRFLFPFLFFLFSLAFKCPFHFLFGCLFPQSLSFLSSLRLFKEKNMRPFSLTGYYYFIQRAIHPIRKRKTCIDLYEMRRPGQARPNAREKNHFHFNINNRWLLLGSSNSKSRPTCTCTRTLNIHQRLNARRTTHHKILNGKEELPEKKHRA